MKNLILLFLVFFSCKKSDDINNKYNCTGEPKYGNTHYLKIPITVTPHQIKYKVGDTLTIGANFTHRIDDISYNKTFIIENALLRPILTIVRFDDDIYMGKVSGPQNILVDSIYDPYYGNSTHSYIRFKNGEYHWENKIVLKKSGRYIFTIDDTSINNEDEKLYTLTTLDFEGYCAGNFLICNMIQGDAHYKEFETEMIYIDKKVVNGNMRSLDDFNTLGVFGSGGYAWETSGTYCFEVE